MIISAISTDLCLENFCFLVGWDSPRPRIYTDQNSSTPQKLTSSESSLPSKCIFQYWTLFLDPPTSCWCCSHYIKVHGNGLYKYNFQTLSLRYLIQLWFSSCLSSIPLGQNKGDMQIETRSTFHHSTFSCVLCMKQICRNNEYSGYSSLSIAIYIVFFHRIFFGKVVLWK